MLKIVFGLVQVNQFQTMEAERTWDCVKKTLFASNCYKGLCS